MKTTRILIALLFLGVFACKNKPESNYVKSEKGVTSDMLPPHINILYNVSAADSPGYHEHAKAMYQRYMQKNEADSALFCLIAWHEVLDQNYIYDSLALYWAVEHFKNGFGSNQNQQELLKLGYYIGSMYYTIDNPDSCRYWFNYTIAHPKSLEWTKVRCRTMLGNILGNYNKMDSAIILKQLNIEFYKTKQDTVNLSISLSNLGNMLRYIYAFEMAYDITREALALSDHKKDTFSMIMNRHAAILCLLEFEEKEDELRKSVFELNQLTNHFSKQNLNIKFTQGLSNLQYYYRVKNLDSLDYWLSKFKLYCEQRGGESLYDYQFHKLRYESLKGINLTDKNWLLKEATSAFENEAYKQAYTCYYILLNDAVKNKDFKIALEYSRTLNEINEKLFEVTNKGKLYELEIKFKTKLKEQELQLKTFEINEKQQKISRLLAIVFIIIILFIIYILFQKQRSIQKQKLQEESFTKQLLEETEQERKRIAQDLHDSVGHDLLNLKKSIHNQLSLSENTIDDIINEVREISRNLFPVMFEEVGLHASLLQLADKIQQSDGLYVINEVTYTKGTLHSDQELLLFRIIQEALSNTIKYAKAQSAKVELIQTQEQLLLSIMDNGQGFHVENVLQSGNAFGLISIKKRAELLGAKAAINSDSTGTRIHITIPITRNKNEKNKQKK